MLLLFLSSCAVLNTKNSNNRNEVNLNLKPEKHILPGAIEISMDSIDMPIAQANSISKKEELRAIVLNSIQKTRVILDNSPKFKSGFVGKATIKKLNKIEKKISSTYGDEGEATFIYGCCCLLLIFGVAYLVIKNNAFKLDFKYFGALLVFLLLTGLLIAMLAKY